MFNLLDGVSAQCEQSSMSAQISRKRYHPSVAIAGGRDRACVSVHVLNASASAGPPTPGSMYAQRDTQTTVEPPSLALSLPLSASAPPGLLRDRRTAQVVGVGVCVRADVRACVRMTVGARRLKLAHVGASHGRR
jgi:hypothetical protein